ncbi:MAG: hypothetical protein K2X38_23715 [Gemmataceae bacterium]|nr:hypothetical protein [Gemmataceae bacterium]
MYPGFRDRLIVYEKTGEIVRRVGIQDLLKDSEWGNVHHVQGNLFRLGETADVLGKSGEPPRMGYRYYRVSPDCTSLEFNIAPDRAMRSRAHSQGKKLNITPRVVRIDPASAVIVPADVKLLERKIPVRPFVGEFTRRGDEIR